MSLRNGLLISSLAAIAAGLVWVLLIQASGWGLWLLAPCIGGAAGYGMMRGMQMRGGMPAGIAAGTITLLVIFGTRYFVISSAVSELVRSGEEEAINAIAYDIATEMEEEGEEPYDDEGGFTEEVQANAAVRWGSMSLREQEEYVGALNEDAEAATEFLTPLAMIFDFGIFGTIFTVLSVGTAFKTASTTLEEALLEKGQAVTGDDAAVMAAKMRGDDITPTLSSGSSGVSRWTMPLPAADALEGPPLQPLQAMEPMQPTGETDTVDDADERGDAPERREAA